MLFGRITFLELAQNLAHDTSTTTPKSLVLRARCVPYSFSSSHLLTSLLETRKTYRAVFSEPRVVIPNTTALTSQPSEPPAVLVPEERLEQPVRDMEVPPAQEPPKETFAQNAQGAKKRPREDESRESASKDDELGEGACRKKKGKKAGGSST